MSWQAMKVMWEAGIVHYPVGDSEAGNPKHVRSEAAGWVA